MRLTAIVAAEDYVCYVAITASQAALASAACQETLRVMDGGYPAIEKNITDLRDFFARVAEHPLEYADGELLKTLKRVRRAHKRGASS